MPLRGRYGTLTSPTAELVQARLRNVGVRREGYSPNVAQELACALTHVGDDAAAEETVVREPERLIRSKGRVRDLGEVFTPSTTIRAILDQLPSETWVIHPSPTFLEPSCGDGNFLVSIFDRKARVIVDSFTRGELPAGSDRSALFFHLLEALSSIYAVDVSHDNIAGSDDHPLGARERLVLHFQRAAKRALGRRPSPNDRALRAARWIVSRNVQVADMLTLDARGRVSGRPTVPLVEYTWHPEHSSVSLRVTTLADVMAAAAAEANPELTLFSSPQPTPVWEGKSTALFDAPVPAPECRLAVVRNGRGTSA